MKLAEAVSGLASADVAAIAKPLAACKHVALDPMPGFSDTRAFGSNPGALSMYLYKPRVMAQAAPLVVLMHGCRQNALEFARDSG